MKKSISSSRKQSSSTSASLKAISPQAIAAVADRAKTAGKRAAQVVRRAAVTTSSVAVAKVSALEAARSSLAKKALMQKAPKSSGSKMQGLNASQFRQLETRLQELAIELKAALDGKAGLFNAGALAESLIKGDDAEVAEKQRVSNAALQELEFLKTRIQLVKRALAKMEAGVYGLCEETEEPIGFERLSVVPWARFAVHVQEMHEKKMRDFKVSRLRSEA